MMFYKNKVKGGKRKALNQGKKILIAFFIAALFSPVLHSAKQQVIVIKGGTVLTMAGKTIPEGIVVIKGNKIEAVGAGIKVPEGAVVVDASGKYVMPGIVDAMTYYGIRPFDLNDTNNPVTPQNRIIQAFHPFGDYIYGKPGIKKDMEILSGGVTSVYIAPGDKQVIGGQGAVLKVYGQKFDDLILREPAAIDMTIGDPPKQAFGTQGKSPVTRMNIAALIRKTLISAQEFEHGWKTYKQKNEKEREEELKPKRDLSLEAIVMLLNKKVSARVEADLVDDIRTAIRIADEFDFNLIVDSGIGAYKIKGLLAEKKIPVVLGPISHPYITGGEISSTPELGQLLNEHSAALLTKAGVKIAIASFGMGFSRWKDAMQGKWLMLEAGLATSFGLPDEEALKAITINAAEILGVDDRIGSLEPGKDADVIILDGPPLRLKTWVDKVFLNGQLVFEKE